jgi:hypothetical protein
MSLGLGILIGFIAGILFMVLLRVLIYNLVKIGIKRGNKLKSQGEQLQAEANTLILELERLKSELNGG